MTSSIVLPVGFGAGVAVLLASWRSRYFRPAAWVALLIIGQAASLQLVEAGPTVRYQHFVTWGRLLTPEHRTAVWILALQALLTGTALAVRVGAILRWTKASVGWLGGGLVAVFFVLSSATLSRSLAAFAGELALASLVQAVSLATVILAAWSLPADAVLTLRRRFDRLLGDPTRGRDPDRGVAWAALAVTLVAAVLCVVVYQRHPHIPDEVGYLIHARYFAEGRLMLPAPPVAEAFNLDLLYYEGARAFSPFPPGWPAALAVGVKLGIPWLMNPLLAGLNLFLVFALLRRLYDRRIARLGVFLLALSPWYVFLAMSFMAHTFTMTCLLLGTLGVLRARENGNLWWALTGGAAVGMVTLIRPLDGLILGGLLGLWAIGLGGRRLKPAPLAAFVIAAGGVTALNLPYNRALTGSPQVFPVMAYFDKYYGPHTNDMGFGPERGVGWTGLDPFPGHNLRDVAINTDFNAFATNVELFGWSTGSLLLVVVLLVSGRARGSDWLMFAAIAAVIAAHSLYWFSGGPDFGARYWYLALLPAVALSARGIQALGELIEEKGPGPEGSTRVLGAAFALSLAAAVAFYPWRATDKYYHYRGMRPDVRQLATEHHFGRSLILIRGKRHPDYASAAAYNPTDLRAGVPIYAWVATREAGRQAIEAYADRPIWIVDGPSVTGDGYQILAGPLAAPAAIGALPGP